jgi:hypothetical protein
MPQSNAPAHPGACIELAGFAAAQAACCLFDKVPFVPMGFSRRGQSHVTLTLLPGGSPAQIALATSAWLDANTGTADAAVVICDAFVTISGVRRDSLVVEGRSYAPAVGQIKLAVLYRPHHHPRGFAIYRPKFIVESLTNQNAVAYRDAFFRGVCLHEAGRRVWDACADESW